MHYVVIGAGAVGGVVGARLFQAGHQVTLIGRGEHLERTQRDGLRLESPAGTGPIAGRRRTGGSTWQSLQRGTGNVETDYLNGEIVRLGRIYGVPTPVNELMQRLAREMAARSRAPGGISEEAVLAELAERA